LYLGRVARIEHAAIWTGDLERLRAFYERYLGGTTGERYDNAQTGFSSYFLDFGGVRLELMQMPSVAERPAGAAQRLGYAHLAFSLGSGEAVDALTAELERDGHAILDGPRRTGDGYYESVVADPDGNRVELTV
jgi:lactoylglutathione lyase